MTTQGYARPELLAETVWLAQRLNDPNIRVVDCEVPDGYNRAHIHGAVNVGANTYLKGQDRIRVMPQEDAAEFMGGLGIGDDTLVVAYDSRSSLLAARLWWVLNYYGHTNVKVLNGGWRKWIMERRPITDKPASIARSTFSPRVNPSLMVKGGDLKAQVGAPGVAIWDVRSLAEHTGENTRGNKHAGPIPGACHLEYLSVMDTDGLATFRPAAEIRRMLTQVGVTPDKQVYTY
jgi:thiosulfate/3-mercaptopyruvate sulfurtransferase